MDKGFYMDQMKGTKFFLIEQLLSFFDPTDPKLTLLAIVGLVTKGVTQTTSIGSHNPLLQLTCSSVVPSEVHRTEMWDDELRVER